MNTQALKAVIDAEPANVARTDTNVLAWLKELVDVYVDITREQFALWSSRHNGKIRLEVAEINGTTDDVKRAASAGLLALNTGNGLSLSLAEVRTLMGNLVDEVFSVPEKDDLLDFSKNTVERFISHGFPAIDDSSWLYHINEARVL